MATVRFNEFPLPVQATQTSQVTSALKHLNVFNNLENFKELKSEDLNEKCFARLLGAPPT